MWLFTKNVFFAVFVPGSVAAWFPLWLVGFRERGFGAFGLAQAVALLFIVAGFLTILSAIGFFGVKGKGTPAIFDPPVHLVVRGPHRYVRNPMYLSVVIIVLAWALWFGSSTLVVYAAIAWLVFHLFVLLYEEPGLRQRFGPEYEAYCRAVRRWLPGRGYSTATG